MHASTCLQRREPVLQKQQTGSVSSLLLEGPPKAAPATVAPGEPALVVHVYCMFYAACTLPRFLHVSATQGFCIPLGIKWLVRNL